jgi:pSer/pThr/pTyr-binding forkhead associated (FHA) protein
VARGARPILSLVDCDDAQDAEDIVVSRIVPVDDAAPDSDQEKTMEPARHFVCPSCSSGVPAGHKFCGRCGAPIPDEIRDLTTRFYGDMQNPAKAKLILIKGDGMDGMSFHLKAEQHIVGREGQLMFPDDPFMSPRHANFFYRDGSLVVKDEESVNGVYVRIRKPVPIDDGDTFLAGDYIFRFSIHAGVEDDGPDDSGTRFYGSPREPWSFKIEQIFRGGSTGMAVFARGSSLVVGRDGADLNFPDDTYLSGEHCRVEATADGHALTDLNSQNGTYVRVEGEHPLNDGDYIFIGRKLLRVELNTN